MLLAHVSKILRRHFVDKFGLHILLEYVSLLGYQIYTTRKSINYTGYACSGPDYSYVDSFIVYRGVCPPGIDIDELSGECKPNSKKYTIKLSQVTAKPSIHGNYITDIYPAKNFINNSESSANPIITSDELVATVYDENGEKINNVNIHVEIKPVESTAGHFKHGVRPKKVSTYGQLVTTTSLDFQLDGNTGTNGFKFRYLAAELSGDYNIKVTCKDKVCNQQQPSKIWVGVENLIPLEKIASLYNFVGDKPTHPDNHYVTEKTRVKMITLAAKYKTKFPNNSVIHYNDSSLERGGLFDVGKDKWKPPHSRHRVGTDVDVRANEASGNIPSKDDTEFTRLARKSGCSARLEYKGTTNEHFHFYCERRYD